MESKMRFLIIAICIFMMAIIYMFFINEANAAIPPYAIGYNVVPFKLGPSMIYGDRVNKMDAVTFQCPQIEYLISEKDELTKSMWNELKNSTNINLHDVNLIFNNFVYIEENNSEDIWKTPTQFVYDGGGDCEDFAIIKYHALKEIGIPASHMYILAFKSDIYKNGHAVLVIFKDSEFLVLDSLTDLILPLHSLGDISPEFAINEHAFYRYVNTKK